MFLQFGKLVNLFSRTTQPNAHTTQPQPQHDTFQILSSQVNRYPKGFSRIQQQKTPHKHQHQHQQDNQREART